LALDDADGFLGQDEEEMVGMGTEGMAMYAKCFMVMTTDAAGERKLLGYGAGALIVCVFRILCDSVPC
jgi:hypothetical protein